MNTENNRLIAEFLTKVADYWQREDSQDDDKNPLYFQPHNTEFQLMRPSEMLFDKDWNWLMEVVEKIEDLNYKVTICRHICRIERIIFDDIVISEDIPKIEAVYKACLSFIKWHNQQKQN